MKNCENLLVFKFKASSPILLSSNHVRCVVDVCAVEVISKLLSRYRRLFNGNDRLKDRFASKIWQRKFFPKRSITFTILAASAFSAIQLASSSEEWEQPNLSTQLSFYRVTSCFPDLSAGSSFLGCSA